MIPILIRRTILFLALGCMLLVGRSALADPIGFGAITDNNGGDGPAIGGQFSVSASPGISTIHSFVVGNSGPISSTITQIYVDTGIGPAYLSTTAIGNGTGVNFAFPNGGVGPNSLPSQNTAIPLFTTDAAFKRNAGSVANGIDPGENALWQILFDDAFDAHAALHAGTLRFGLHVQRIQPGGGSDSFVISGDPGPDPGPTPDPQTAPIPEPTSMAIWVILLVAVISGFYWCRVRVVGV